MTNISIKVVFRIFVLIFNNTNIVFIEKKSFEGYILSPKIYQLLNK